MAVAGCGGARKQKPAKECFAWKSVRYCFPSENIVAISKSGEKVSTHLRVPLGPPELRRRNAPKTQLDYQAYPYDSVDVMLTSAGPPVGPETIVADSLRWENPGAAALRCPARETNAALTRKICIERDPRGSSVHLVSCTQPDGIGIASCSDRTVADNFDIDIDYSLACDRVRHEMRDVVRKYLETFRRRTNG